ncbi:MAG: DEAD/DEAH box helicase family protein [Candidatus Marinimicrobia bacterium]|nr:DEAD/DEAH box helicase family protein [Candidatus Neomarinimicrobiota bacterium]
MAKGQLHERLSTGATFLGSEDYFQALVPKLIWDNLRPDFGKRTYQAEALGRFKYYLDDYPAKPKNVPIHLLFHMATGSGKTLIMAGLMLFLFSKGYRNFLFFVNSTNIIDKTRDNFLNSISAKYLFNKSVQIASKNIRIKEVNNFSGTSQDDINIVFSTIQGLHTRLTNPRENTITFDDFENQKIVLISDEAHHINATTKKGKDLGQEEIFELTSWEQTVTKIFNANPSNIMLEFTATADLAHPEIVKKYIDKIIFDYPLKEFRNDGYSKEVKVLQADLPDFDRALQAVIMSQYRLKLFSDYGKLIKPVILFKSRTIKESEAFFTEFLERMRKLKSKDLAAIKNHPNIDPLLEKIFSYFDQSGINLRNLALELKEDFSEAKSLLINSEDINAENSILVNTLESDDNLVRAVFAVAKLNEGWDVLNLFDIVRLYDTRDAKAGKPGRTTVSEAQLIGRGARYCPFQISNDQPLFQRKFDIMGSEEEHRLKICEELYYHSSYNPRYIDELHTALEEIGMKASEVRQRKLRLKPHFKETTFFESGLLFLNEQQKYSRSDIQGIPSSFINTVHKYSLETGYTLTTGAFDDTQQIVINRVQRDYQLINFGDSVVRKAINRLQFYQFSNLTGYFPNLDSITQFISDKKYLGELGVEVSGRREDVESLTQHQKLNIAVDVLEKLSTTLQTDKIDYKGSREFKPYLLRDKIIDKTLNYSYDGSESKEAGIGQSETTDSALALDLSNKDWYVFNENYGTSEEKRLVKYIDKVYEKLQERFDQIYLVRNERHFKIFSFDDGRAIEPDFVLFLSEAGSGKTFHYQVFIEPKGDHLLLTDAWKEKFLLALKEEHELEQLWSDKKFIIWGMPFYNFNQKVKEFSEAFQDLLPKDVD